MDAFITLSSGMIPVLEDNIDTDQIIPARFLKRTTREGFGDFLFKDWRFDSDENRNENFPLNQSSYTGRILLTGDNFGCGSSREHAAWAIYDYGFRAIIATSFADIFKNNALNNGLVPIQVSAAFHNELKEAIEQNPSTEVTVDLENQKVHGAGKSEHFEIDPFKKSCLMTGTDEFSYLVGLRDDITRFEKERHEL